MTDLEITVKVKRLSSKKLLAKADLLAMIDRRASEILDVGAWLDEAGEPVIPNVMDEQYLQALYDIRQFIQTGNIAA